MFDRKNIFFSIHPYQHIIRMFVYHKPFSWSKKGSLADYWFGWFLLVPVYCVFWFMLVCCWGTLMFRFILSYIAIYCFNTFIIWSAVLFYVKEPCSIIYPIILLFIIILSIWLFSVCIDYAIFTASNEFICWFTACDILPNMFTKL
jgi:hypothetical protein